MKKLFIGAMGAILVAMVSTLFLGTTYTKGTYSIVNVSGWGSFKTVGHTFVARTDTVFFPFTVEPAWGARDTISVYAGLRTNKNGNDSVNVLWVLQWNYRSATAPYAEWLSQTVAADSAIAASSTWTQKTLLAGPRSYNQGYPPYLRIVAIGQTPNGGKANEIGNTAAVAILKE